MNDEFEGLEKDDLIALVKAARAATARARDETVRTLRAFDEYKRRAARPHGFEDAVVISLSITSPDTEWCNEARIDIGALCDRDDPGRVVADVIDRHARDTFAEWVTKCAPRLR